jgi:hypothetical protein
VELPEPHLNPATHAQDGFIYYLLPPQVTAPIRIASAVIDADALQSLLKN